VAAVRDEAEQEHLDVPEMPVRIRHDPSPGFIATLVQRASR
jgi:hypothetical protein